MGVGYHRVRTVVGVVTPGLYVRHLKQKPQTLGIGTSETVVNNKLTELFINSMLENRQFICFHIHQVQG